MSTITETVYVLDEDGLFRVVGMVDTDKVFYATAARWDRENKEWDVDFLTQFQQDSETITPIAADPNEEVLAWFGLAAEDIVDEQVAESEMKKSIFLVEQKYETWYRVEVIAESLDAAVDMAIEQLSAGEGVENADAGEWCDEYWAQNADTGDEGMVETDRLTAKWVMI